MAKTERPTSYDQVAFAAHSNFCRSQQDFACHLWGCWCTEVQATSKLWRDRTWRFLQLLSHTVI